MIHPGDMAGKGPLGLKGAKPRRDRGHMARVAALPCVCCGAWPVECHHVICGRYSQRRAPDTHTIPLCRLIIAPRLSPGGGNLTTNGASDG